MKLDVRKTDDVVIVDLDGRLVSGVGDEVLRAAMNQLLADDWRKILLNLSEVQAIDSTGISELVASRKIAERFGASLKLMRVKGRVERVLSMSQLLPLFQVYRDEEDALEAFAKAT